MGPKYGSNQWKSGDPSQLFKDLKLVQNNQKLIRIGSNYLQYLKVRCLNIHKSLFLRGIVWFESGWGCTRGIGFCQPVDCEWKNNERIIHNNNKTTDDVFNPAHNRGGWTRRVRACVCVQPGTHSRSDHHLSVLCAASAFVCVCVFVSRESKQAFINIHLDFFIYLRAPRDFGDMDFRFNRNNSPSLIFTLTTGGWKMKGRENANQGAGIFSAAQHSHVFSELLLLFMGAQCECYIVVTLEWRRLYYLLLLIRIHRMQIMTLRGWIFIYFSRSAAQEKTLSQWSTALINVFPGKSLQTAFCSVLFQALVFHPLSAAAAVSDEILYLSTRIHLQREGIDVHTVWMEEFWCQGIRFQIGGIIAYFSSEGKQNWLYQTQVIHTKILNWNLVNTKIHYILK